MLMATAGHSKKKIDAETRFYQIILYAQMIAPLTIILGFLIIFYVLLSAAGLI
ncbi:MAG: hypothetical protein ABH854_05070 [Candidatus Diapherotrites archaeon]